MKAFKGCTNELCKAYKKIHYKNDDNFCSKCGERLSYVCADCWTVLPDQTERYCEVCRDKREKDRARREEQIKQAGDKVVKFASALGTAAVEILKNSDKIEDGAKLVVKKGKEVATLIKK